MFKLNNLTSLQLFQLIRYGTFVLIAICFVKLHLSQTDIAQYETFILVSGLISFFWVSGLINSMLSIYAKKNEEEKKTILFNTFLSLVFFSILAAFFLLTFESNLLSFLNKGEDRALILLAIVYMLFNNPSFLIEYILFLNAKKKGIVGYGIIIALASLLVAVVPVALKWGNYWTLEYAMMGLIFIAIIRFLFTIYLLAKYASFKPDLALLKKHLQLSIPIILSIFVSGSAEYIDGLIIKSKFNDALFTVYRYGAKELPVLLIIANTFSTAMIHPIAANLENGLIELKEKASRMMHFFFPITILLMLASPYLYPFIFNASFRYSALIFNIYLLLIIPRVLFPQTVLTGIHQTKYLLISSILEIILNVSLSIYLAGKIGLKGVAIGTLIAYSFDKIFLLIVVRNAFKISPNKLIKLKPYLVYVALTIVSFAASYVLMKKY